LGYAAIALAVLAIFLPIMMAKKARTQAEDSHYQVFGGNVGLVASSVIGFVIISAQILITFGVLPALG
ncbi:hypothetical protein AKJ18_33555, partial [Vibrio xuii]